MAEDLLNRILAEAGLSAPDGRLLHAYGLSDAHFAAIPLVLGRLDPRAKRGRAVAALYVLWASEHIRRRYDGSGLSWEFINTDVPQVFDGTTIAGFVRSGLDVWQRPLRRGQGGNRLFMYTLLAEGGIPLAVLESAGRHTQVLRDMIDAICSRGGIAGLGYETAFDMAHQKMRYLPNILQDRDSVSLFLDLAQAIHDLREAVPPGLEGGQRQDWLDRERPGWQRSLPLRVTPQIIENIIHPSLAVAHPMLRIGPWQAQLEQILSASANKTSRERLTLIRIFEDLRGLGYEGGYDAVRRFAKTWSQNRGAVTAEAYVPLSYAPGEAYQFDWSHEVVLISGVTVTVKVAHVRLCHSRMMFARAYMRESQEMVFDAHDRAFAFFKGACTRGIYDSEA